MSNVVRKTVNVWNALQGWEKSLVSSENKLYSNLKKAYNAASLQAEHMGIEMPSYSAVQKTMTADLQIWAKQFRTDNALVYICFERETVI